jgi:molybdenum cofactor synthesis domain-containing protein
MIRGAVVTVSDKGHAGLREDVSGPLLAALLEQAGVTVVAQSIVPDEVDAIQRVLLALVHLSNVDVVVTTGGTGPTPRDITPEATLSVIDRELPGLCEVLRLEGYRNTPLASLSRGISGIRARTLIVNLPGSPKAVREGVQVLIPILPHAVRMARGVDTDHTANHG